MNARSMSRYLVTVTLLAFLLSTLPTAGRAGIIGTADSLGSQDVHQRSVDLAFIQRQLARSDVQQRLAEYGVTPAQAQERVAALNDAEIAELAKRIDRAPAGADGGLLALVGLVFVVLIILDYIGALHVFSHHR